MAKVSVTEDIFESLRVRFRARVRTDLATLEAMTALHPQSEADGKPLAGIVHSLSGSSGTLGFCELGERAARLEELLIASPPGDADEIREGFDDLLAEMRRIAG
ncbi:MAG: Hpt domain-containing protein [Alphaproteobacteria bacterium]|nr:Hpt domain-containing protein [Alphaproteobacteria bacterium]MCB9931719.1 Hpt domain-containing protein [Alphaproteobacteria bacterium]